MTAKNVDIARDSHKILLILSAVQLRVLERVGRDKPVCMPHPSQMQPQQQRQRPLAHDKAGVMGSGPQEGKANTYYEMKTYSHTATSPCSKEHSCDRAAGRDSLVVPAGVQFGIEHD